jgi:medium-chain acyl-[acyl-carrier-protein] hydrolase
MIHQEDFIVRAYELDAKGKASVPTICNYLQEVAGNHATILGVAVDHLFKKNLTWILSRLHVHFAAFPHWREKIIVETWPSGREGKYATRDFLIFNQKGEVLVRATSSWMMLDLYSLRPIVMPGFIHEIPIPDRERAIDDSFTKLTQPGKSDSEKQFDVRLHDLDINRHVNNVKYIEWTLESIPIDVWDSKIIKGLEISFRSETKYGESIRVHTENNANIFLHRIVSEKDQRILALLTTRWRDK